MGGLGITNPCHFAAFEYKASAAMTVPLVEQIVSQTHELPDNHANRTLQQHNQRDKDVHLRENLEEVKNALPEQTKKAAKLAAEKGASSWLTVSPVKDVYSTQNKCACADVFYVDHTMVCRCSGFIIQRYNDLHDLEARMLKMAGNYVQIEHVLQEINRSADT